MYIVRKYQILQGPSWRDRIVFGIITTYEISMTVQEKGDFLIQVIA